MAMEIIAKKITKEGISKEMTFGNALLFDDFLGRPHGYTYSTYTHERFARSIDSTCYAIIYAGKRRIIADQQIDDSYRDNFDATYKSKWSKEVLERRQRKHRRLSTVLRKINSKYKYLTQAEGTPEFKELQKLLGA